jgi:2-dehydro-3-deoxygalactonokinase
MMKEILCCDWGTSSFRLRLINKADGSVIAETTDGKGIAAVYNDWLHSGLAENERVDYYKKILLSQIEKLATHSPDGVPIIISGMASSSIGITELPYTKIPFDINGAGLHLYKIAANESYRHDIYIVPGLRSDNDVMRGEETRLLGCDIGNNDEQLFIFPGTHSKHVVVQDNVVKDFKTYMTGELFDLLSNKSMLATSVERSDGLGENDIKQFKRGVKESTAANLLNNIFHTRTNQLFNILSKKENYYYLSGLLIGEELKDIQKKKYKNVTVVSSGILSTLYAEGLSITGLRNELRHQNADKALIKGQIFILNQYQ